MNIKAIELLNFRNYASQRVNFENGVNVLYGNNAQGKTNLLEAIFLCSIGKSHRSVPDKEMIRHNCDCAMVKAMINAKGRDFKVESLIGTQKRKLIKVNSIPLERTSELIGMFNAVLFTPDDIHIITGGPGLRRKLIDMFISQLRPIYLNALISYNRALEQKSKLLKLIAFKPDLADTVDIWNEEMAQYGSIIIKYRAEYIKKLSSIMGVIHNDITLGIENSLINYDCNIKLPIEGELLDIKNSLLTEFEKSIKREKEQKLAIIGPHRDDIQFYVKQEYSNKSDFKDLSAKNFASRGQCRTGVLSLRLAQLEVIKKEKGEYPVLLLDDITSELDQSRRQYLFNKVKGMQAIITCTDADLIGKSNNAKFFKVDGGKISQ